MAMSLRGAEFQWLDTPFSLFDSGEYRNIDLVIGSSYNDILVGDWLGGNTLTGGYGNDIFVVHGGSNVIKFYDTDFSSPGEDLVKKSVHGLTLQMEAVYFNSMNYAPDFGTYFRLDADKLDFSAMDANLSVEGNQAFEFIFFNEFTGKAGELRLDTDWAADPSFTLQGDRTGDGIADFEVEYEIYFTNPFVRTLWSPFITEENLIL
ncbi:MULTISPECIES: hypothetical protein [Pseudomonas]|uniref:Peptidase M10 serralysin C-terminal domain-containing protein n=1 Tax=Pseudomonas fulva TaxID=47880 RepID=A0A0D0KLU7_9PSED|nr:MULTISPECIES: hypothetical protein [Pseudomonas]KIP97950.1 hypothetical protein RU08_17330 [Pseudomonas fulva]